MALTLDQKLNLIRSNGWIGLGYGFLRETSQEATNEIERLRSALRLFVDMPEKFDEPDFLDGIGRMRRAFDTAKAVLQQSA